MNPETTLAYLIAVDKYDDEKFHPLPAAWDNVNELFKTLKSDLVGLQNKTNIARSINPEVDSILIKDIKKLIEANPQAKTLIIYYAGHGDSSEDGDHFLTLKSSTLDDLEIDGLEINKLGAAWSKKPNLNIIFILDSCFSEKAFKEINSNNYLVLASSSRKESSKYPVNEEYSAFTGELLKVMNEGIDIPSKKLTWQDIYQQVKTNLKKNGFPEPKIAVRNEVDKTEVCVNRFNSKEINLEDRWIRLIKEEIGIENKNVQEEIEGILNAGGSQKEQKLMELLLDIFPFPIAFHLKPLFEQDAKPEAFFAFYETVIRFLFIINFMYYERLKSSGKIKANEAFRNNMMDFSEPDHDFYSSMLRFILEDIKSNNAKLFIEEFDFFDPRFQKVIEGLEKERTAKEPRLNVIKDFVLQMVPLLRFFLNYKLLSIKDVHLNYRKYTDMEFNHWVSLLQGNSETKYEVWSKMDEPWQKAFVKNPEAKNSRSVIFMDSFEENMGDYLNLWPLVVDKNAAEEKTTVPEVYLYSGIDGENNYMFEKVGLSKKGNIKSLKDLEAHTVSPKLDNFKELIAR